MTYKWERLLGDPKLRKAIEKAIRCRPGMADSDKLDDIVGNDYLDLPGAKNVFYLDYEGGGCYGGYWLVFKWLGKYFFYDGFDPSMYDETDVGPFDSVEDALKCAAFPMGDEYDEYVNVTILSCLSLAHTKQQSVLTIKDGYHLKINGHNYVRKGEKLCRLELAKLGEKQHGYLCVGVEKPAGKKHLSEFAPWLASAFAQLKSSELFEEMTGRSFDHHVGWERQLSCRFPTVEMSVEKYLGVLVVTSDKVTNYWILPSKVKGAQELWGTYFRCCLDSLKSLVPPSILVSRVLEVGDDPVKLGRLLIELGVFPEKGTTKNT